jgi:hypothetical protein
MANQSKILLGTSHRPQDLGAAIGAIDQYNPRVLGLELPEDHLDALLAGMQVLFFHDLYEYNQRRAIRTPRFCIGIPHFRKFSFYSKIKPETVFLDDPSLLDFSRSIEIAKSVIKGQLKIDDLKREVEYQKIDNLEQVSPEEFFYRNKRSKRYEGALEILGQEKDMKGIYRLFYDNVELRNAHMVQQILKCSPDLVIVGVGHAISIRHSLPGYDFGVI